MVGNEPGVDGRRDIKWGCILHQSIITLQKRTSDNNSFMSQQAESNVFISLPVSLGVGSD